MIRVPSLPPGDVAGQGADTCLKTCSSIPLRCAGSGPASSASPSTPSARTSPISATAAGRSGTRWIVVGLARWMADERVAIGDLDERRVVKFVEAPRRRDRTCPGFERTALQLIEQLPSAGVVPSPEPARDDSPTTALLARYEEYLRRERALARSTITAYRRFVRAFVIERRADRALRPAALCAGEVREFLLARVRRMAPRRAQAMAGTAVVLAVLVPAGRDGHGSLARRPDGAAMAPLGRAPACAGSGRGAAPARL